MKILMQGKVDLLDVGGGDRIQIENTARELQKLGIEIDIIPGFKVDYAKYDLVHLFQLDWTPETAIYAKKVKKAQKPLVLSPIHHSVKELKKFDDFYIFDFRRIAKFLFKSQFKRDTFKNIYKSFFDTRKLYPTVVSMVRGLQNMQRTALKASDTVLVQTKREAQDLIDTYDVQINWKIVPNGVGEPFLNAGQNPNLKNPLPFENYIICVGRIEARKNQLSIISAVDKFRKVHNLDTRLVFVGRKSKLKHMEYIFRFDQKVKKLPWVYHLNEVPYEQMPALYKFAKVNVSASWFETTGLTGLEALFCETNTVASGERAKEYLGDFASYCEPDSIDSIQKAIAKEYWAPRPKCLDDKFKDYTWENAAKKTLTVYQEVLLGTNRSQK